MNTTDITSATKINNGTDIWTGKCFDYDTFTELKSTLFGAYDPAVYITQNRVTAEYNRTKSSVITATQINAKITDTNLRKYGYVLKLGGLDWVVASMTLGGYDSTTGQEGDVPVLTLYLADDLLDSDGNAVTTAFLDDNLAANNNTKGRSMYSSSTLRKNITTGTGDYSKLALFASDSSFAQKFLVQPNDIKYQHKQTMYGRESGNWNNMPNEALDDAVLPTSHYGYTNPYKCGFYYDGTANGAHGSYAKYEDWGEDYIWIPSATEVGVTDLAASTNIWQLTNEQKRHTQTAKPLAWFRCGHDTGAAYYQLICIAGGATPKRADLKVNEIGYVRPAIHLNLAMVEEFAGTPVPQAYSEATYNGDYQDLQSQSWYKMDLYGRACDVKYTDSEGNECTPKAAGIYTATFTIKSDKGYVWAGDTVSVKKTATFEIKPYEVQVDFDMGEDGYPYAEFLPTAGPLNDETVDIYLTYNTDDGDPPVHRGPYTATAFLKDKNYKLVGTTTYNFTMKARRVELPKWNDNKDEDTYNGDTRRFMIVYNSTTFKVSVPTKFNKPLEEGGIKLNGNLVMVTQAGDYELTVEIKDQSGDVWWNDADNANPRTVQFKVKPAEFQLSFMDQSITVASGQQKTITVYPPNLWGEDEISVNFGAKVSGGDPIMLTDQPVKFSSDNTTGTYSVQLATDYLMEGTYDLHVEGDNPNYVVTLPDGGVPLIVSEILSVPSVTWTLRNGVNPQIGRLVSTSETAQFTPSQMTGDYHASGIFYDGQIYYVNATPSIGFMIDRTYNANGFKNGIKTVNSANEAAQGQNAGTYTTTVHLKSTSNSGETFDYSVTFEILKAKIDLSNVKWQNDGKMPYTGNVQTCELEGLPEGITANYQNAQTGQNVGPVGLITVTLELSDEAKKNYYEPKESDSTSYEGENFKWSLNWEIVQQEIKLDWKIEGLHDTNNALFNGYVLKTGGEFIKYYYYETNSNGVINDDVEPLEEITVPKDKIKYYKVKATIAEGYADNYKLAAEDENCYSPFFEVGRPVTEVQVKMSKDTYTYWGSPITFQFYASKGSVSTSYFDVTYWSGNTQLSSAPKDVGTYRATISLKREYRNSYSLQGTTEFTFEIVQKEIEIDWDESKKPPILVLNTAEAKAISYEYVDENKNPISTLQKGNNYSVRAVIKDTKNYVFKNGASKTATDWIDFTIAPTDSIIDPNDPDHYLDVKDPNTDTTGKETVRFDIVNNKVTFTGEPLAAVFTNDKGLGEGDYEIVYYSLDTNNVYTSAPTAAGSYRIVITLVGEKANEFTLDPATSVFVFTISSEIGDNNPTPTPTPSDGGNTGDDPSNTSIMSYLPIIVSGIALVLIIVFTVMTLNNLSAAKEAKEKTKKLAQVSYSFAPVGLLAIVLGLAESNWWIIAGVLMGIALIMAIVAFMAKGKKKRAFAMLEEEKERIEEEKEMARLEREEMAREEQRREMREEQARAREEQARRDNEMRMMFAAMQQGGGGYGQAMQYEDMQTMIASTISALLPTIQQQMALPPAQSDPNVYAPQPDYAARAENEALRAQLAAQEERMAQQQELLNQILQNQQAQQAYEEEPVDDISWLGESDEVVSLEESYGNLDDEGRRAYYEIGSYIMSKPRTSQNDGRYAVLFKYRGRTIFKLAIKDDAPVLYYPAGNGKAEVRITDASSLGLAKSMVDRTVANVDSQM